ncbi:Ubiquinol cytochrome c reductase subunit RIP1 [Klebsormidium nitens]|uniref:Ubiquinol cytochrome c reductase subunit RIP1 n=1 Tax=Klebsormidium nitens TaxID=105231 RepID=A0A1Y1I136_KLENI|nr:Ubiquinol cytochrome c reductase subunit RIP1 [Klebsormidium nitens]|eukprot:GAQ83159.1 Ubiquinol cytochrome c reductase subunit RIP1 [Klebsormidium nitens]
MKNGPSKAAARPMKGVVRADVASTMPKERVSDAAERLAGGPAKNDKDHEKFLHIAQEANAKVPGLTETVWGQKVQGPKYPALDKDLKVDVVVIGAGISGLSIAYNLAKAGKKVAVLEGKSRGSGQTGKTTAHIMLWNDDYYHMLEKTWGEEWMKKVGESHREAGDFIENVIKEEGFDGGYTRTTGYLVANDEGPTTLDMLRKEADAARRAGFEGAELIDLKGDRRHGGYFSAIRWPASAEIQPLMYINGLADAIVKHGGHIYEMTQVSDIDGNRVATKTGHSVTADAVVVATGSPINHNLAIHSRQHAMRSYVVGLKLEKDSVERASWWDTMTPYHYTRVESFDDHDVLVVGGSDHPTGQHPSEYYNAYAQLEHYARERWTQAGETLYRWTGQLMEPDDQLALYGREPLDVSGCHYIATGDSGQGMTGGTIAGLVISSLILNGNHKWAEVYSPSRIAPPNEITVTQLAGSIKTVTQGLAEAVLPKKLNNVSDVRPGDGAVIQTGTKQVAVFRDEDGKAHTYSAICPHLKCETQWNPNDMTFDCPCHGSQFDRYGKCIQGPAKEGLQPLEL